ncbi:DUF6731 family protein [Nonomuraea fuscirosea]|uniref:DUF6731 family protein n=1 Tax=Nonomuraea fuscirosea TaxID=1291556 RepID=UPI0034279AE6
MAFFEIVDKENQRIEQIDWPQILGKVFHASIKDRTHLGKLRTLVGHVITYDEQDHLLLGKVKDETEWVERINFEDGSIEQFTSAENQGLLETSVVCFLAFGNVVGMIRGSTSAPGCSALEEWINGLSLLDREIKVRAIVNSSAMEKIRKANGARMMELRVGTSKAAVMAESGNRLGRTMRTLREEYGDIKVTITVEVAADKAHRRAQHELLDDVMELATHSDVTEKAKARLTYWDNSEDAHAEDVNLMQERITAKRIISSLDDSGQSIRNSSAVAAIMDVAVHHDRELRLSVEAT